MKKLTIKRTTIRTLGTTDLAQVAGGAQSQYCGETVQTYYTYHQASCLPGPPMTRYCGNTL